MRGAHTLPGARIPERCWGAVVRWVVVYLGSRIAADYTVRVMAQMGSSRRFPAGRADKVLPRVGTVDGTDGASEGLSCWTRGGGPLTEMGGTAGAGPPHQDGAAGLRTGSRCADRHNPSLSLPLLRLAVVVAYTSCLDRRLSRAWPPGSGYCRAVVICYHQRLRGRWLGQRGRAPPRGGRRSPRRGWVVTPNHHTGRQGHKKKTRISFVSIVSFVVDRPSKQPRSLD